MVIFAASDWKPFQSCSIQLSNFLNIFCAAVATAQQVPLTRALAHFTSHPTKIYRCTNHLMLDNCAARQVSSDSTNCRADWSGKGRINVDKVH
jgi:hypothetical protein